MHTFRHIYIDILLFEYSLDGDKNSVPQATWYAPDSHALSLDLSEDTSTRTSC